ncbi:MULTISPECIES: Fe(3+) ABC transporter substrate-binding protein [Halomonadaceae]|jgi:iron(III) transport system substrate-binding protein|uniref:Fe(3+) ABC transporter substrate-binding protein n=1 Tax=Vreelandella janggokensis TaxID=370767 RepID=A0ABT4IVL2_9GAMM|nr:MULTISPECIES: Fe(3+) ABC transporter substrate-binding protein [Halomonas]MCW4149118.1 Fe(3+) ABC transporter substrate-binding protein [Halomonas sp. 18H]MCZ0927700.1 Fe(3+) ABC transporter substrate-binding protein [Halomonas janggokensis]MCZ0930842.1 Fe(3+) ABC transporter substrate-binding protein [Halomonas janggokensis]MDR5884353.1 Fe(3+) ABC transporter substrate-binding protein [Halomonas janggokensis]QPL45592.1 Fe(3+) ABC transporter substrate-binding protein [Halomonas sp. A40-4]
MKTARFAAPIAFALASSAFASHALADELNIYSARHYDSDERLYDAFTEETGIEVNILEGDSDQLIERIQREGVASPADIMMTVDAGRLWRAEQEGIFQGIESDVLAERLPESMRHPEGLWFGFSQRARAIFYNRENVDPGDITRYEDLASDDLGYSICIRSSNNIYNQSLLASMIEHHGEEGAEEWAQGVVDNMARDPEGGDTDQILGAASGECDLAVANHYYYVRLLKSDDEADREAARNVGIIFPNQDDRGAHVNVGGAGVVEGAPNRENAVAFLEFLASDTAQEIFASGNNEFPVVNNVKRDPVLESWGNFKKDDVNISILGENNPEAIRIFDRVEWR